MKPSKQFVVYHANCMDGFTSMFFALKAMPEAEAVPASHGKWDVSENMVGADVYFVDFCPTLEQLGRLLDGDSKVWVLDHHKTAFDLLRDFEHRNLKKVFDQYHSGAGIAYKYFVGDEQSLLAKYVEDRDLYKNILPHTNEISMFIMSHSFTLDAWNDLERDLNTNFSNCVALGTYLERHKKKEMALILQGSYLVVFEGHEVPCINTPTHQSDLCAALYTLYNDAPFSVAWKFDGENYRISLRTNKDKVDLAKLAERYGGGGHRQAAGMSVRSLPWEETGSIRRATT